MKNHEPHIRLLWYNNADFKKTVQQNCLRLCFKCFCKAKRKQEKIVNSLQYSVNSFQKNLLPVFAHGPCSIGNGTDWEFLPLSLLEQNPVYFLFSYVEICILDLNHKNS